MPNAEQRHSFHRLLTRYFIVCYSIFVLTFILFIIIGRFSSTAVSAAYSLMESAIAGSGIVNSNLLVSTILLFFNNFRVAILCTCLGFLPFLFLPAIILVLNAGISGLMIAYVSSHTGIPAVSLILRGILPHGIFEITAIVLAAALGLVICEQLMLIIQNKPLLMPFQSAVAYSFFLLITTSVPMLIAAAVIENYVTPHLVSNIH